MTSPSQKSRIDLVLVAAVAVTVLLVVAFIASVFLAIWSSPPSVQARFTGTAVALFFIAFGAVCGTIVFGSGRLDR